jgi:hypothetical protein
MVNGAHFLVYSTDPASDQAALADLLASVAVAAGDERLIFALPPSEIATHGGAAHFTQRHAGRDLLGAIVYLMCDNVDATIEQLKTKGLRHTGIAKTEFGIKTSIVLPSGGEIGLYQPSHETAIDRQSRRP